MKPKKLLSCQRCRLRKIKCNFENPCLPCARANIECISTVDDKRKKRPSAEYVTRLQKQVAAMADYIKKLHSIQDPEEREKYLREVAPPKEPEIDSDDEKHKSETNGKPVIFTPLQKTTSETRSRAVYGPTSVYRDSVIINEGSSTSSDTAIRALNADPEVLQCLKLFFKWQYPDHNMFIFREAFLIDFFQPKPDSLYCSVVLVWAICALGSRMSEDDHIYSKSRHYYNEAKNHLLSNLGDPCITSLQAYLLLAFYDICNGSNSSGWMLSGNAMRMGFDIGFQLNPQVWFLKSKEDLSPLDVDIRSRIYWGSYVADHFISLVLGRPSILKASDASISETTDLPDLEWIDEFMYSSLKDLSISIPIRKIVNLISISDNMLHDVFTKPSENEDELDLSSKSAKLDEYNHQIRAWKSSLPDSLQWDRNSLKMSAENPTLGAIRYYYYILVLCLNRPFIGIDEKSVTNAPLAFCLEAIDDLYEAVKRFRSVHGCRRASIFIIYCSILSISVLLLTNTELVDEKRDRVSFFMQVLRESSKTWKLAEKSHNLISLRIEEMEKEKENQKDVVEIKEEVKFDDVDLFDKDLDFLGGPPVLMTSDLFNEDWESLFPDYMFKK